MAKLGTRTLLASTQPALSAKSIVSNNYTRGLSRYRDRKLAAGGRFVFGESVKIKRTELVQIITDAVNIMDGCAGKDLQRKVVLVGHNIKSELINMERLGVRL